MNRDFAVSIVQTTIAVAGFLALLGALEHGIRTRRLPQSDSPYQFSQWGTWVIAALVVIITIVMQLVFGHHSADDMDAVDAAELRFLYQERNGARGLCRRSSV